MPSFDFAILIPSASRVLFGTFPSSCPLSFFPYFLLLSYNYPGVFLLLSPPCCSHAQGVLCGLHTSCMGSPFPIYYTKWSPLYFSLSGLYFVFEKWVLSSFFVSLVSALCTLNLNLCFVFSLDLVYII